MKINRETQNELCHYHEDDRKRIEINFLKDAEITMNEYLENLEVQKGQRSYLSISSNGVKITKSNINLEMLREDKSGE
jgi:hypothetical protein